jgi:hypothetical protein
MARKYLNKSKKCPENKLLSIILAYQLIKTSKYDFIFEFKIVDLK